MRRFSWDYRVGPQKRGWLYILLVSALTLVIFMYFGHSHFPATTPTRLHLQARVPVLQLPAIPLAEQAIIIRAEAVAQGSDYVQSKTPKQASIELNRRSKTNNKEDQQEQKQTKIILKAAVPVKSLPQPLDINNNLDLVLQVQPLHKELAESSQVAISKQNSHGGKKIANVSQSKSVSRTSSNPKQQLILPAVRINASPKVKLPSKQRTLAEEGNWDSLRNYSIPQTSDELLAAHLSNDRDSIPRCSPVHDVFFLKTRKTGGSAIQNIMMRYGYKNNLTFAVPPGDNLLGYPYLFTTKFVSTPEKIPFNFVCHHLVYNWQERPVVAEQAKYISILREPSLQLESMFHYSGLSKMLQLNGSSAFTHFVVNRESYYKDKQNWKWKPDMRNPNLFDFGITLSKTHDPVEYDAVLELASKKFDFIMLHEKFHESLILLKDFLCWDWNDIVVFHINNYKHHQPREKLNSTVKAYLKDWLAGEYHFYNYFKQRFELRIQSYGVERMAQDVQYLQRLSARWLQECVEKRVAKNEIVDEELKPWHNDTLGFQLRDTHAQNVSCRLLVMPEMGLTEMIQKRQLGKDRDRIIKEYFA